MHEWLDILVDHGALADIDRHFALLAGELDGHGNVDAVLAAALASAKHRAGHTCWPLAECAGRRLAAVLDQPPATAASGTVLPPAVAQMRLPERRAWRAALARSAVASVHAEGGDRERPAVDADDEPRPLVLDADDRLYLNRLFDAERRVAERMRTLAAAPLPPPAALDAVLASLFDDAGSRQAAAARVAATRRLCIVTGGPGTGKTTLAARIVALLVHLDLANPRRIALAAPTGKAATRLQESMATQLADLAGKVPALAGYAPSTSTIHRLLSDARSNSRLPVDALVVDECSMVDLSLMQRIAGELPADIRLILLGDAAQLSSVQPGAVFADLCAAGRERAAELCGSFVELTESHRFDAGGGIGRLAAAVVAGDARTAIAALREDAGDGLELRALPDAAAVDQLARRYATEQCAPRIEALRDGAAATSPFPALRVLCAHRNGPFGADRFNALVERCLREHGVVEADEPHYVGRPLIVTRNDPQTGLANGDTGVVVDHDGKRRVWFPELDEPGGGERFLVAPARLPEHESVFALNVHRAQGSEYDEVAFIPGPAESRVASRELLYTAITRARRKVIVYGDEAGIAAATGRPTARATGMRARLQGR